MQLINILFDRGVPRSVLRQVVLNDIQEYIEASRAAMRDARQLQAWLHEYHRADPSDRPISFGYGLPERREAVTHKEHSLDGLNAKLSYSPTYYSDKASYRAGTAGHAFFPVF